MQLDRQSRIAIRLNGERFDTDARTLAELVASQGFAATSVATAVNGAFRRLGAERGARRNAAHRRRQDRDRGTAPGRLIHWCA
jgi:hypothetical protein